jgi:hypothetical protein
MYKRYATTAYDIRNLLILSIESVSAPKPTKAAASDFHIFCDAVLGSVPKVLNFTEDPNVFNHAATRYAVQFGIGWILRLYKDEFNTYNDGGLTLLQGIIAAPLQFSTMIWQQSGYSTLPEDMKVTATVTTASYRAMIPFWTVLLFGSITCLVWVYFLDPATLNSLPFPEIDITSKSSLPVSLMQIYYSRYPGASSACSEDLGKGMRSSGLGNSIGRSAFQGLRRRKIYCGE